MLTTFSVKKIVNNYFKIQDAKASVDYALAQEPNEALEKMSETLGSLDTFLKRPLTNYVNATIPGKWAMTHSGIDHFLAAGLVAYIDPSKAKTAGAVWRYAGLEPNKDGNSSKVTYNPDLKNICWKLGLALSKDSTTVYGKLYAQDKSRRLENNELGAYSDKALDTLLDNNHSSGDMVVLVNGKLPDDQIDAQARRFAVKIFLSHYHAIAYQDHYGKPANRPSIVNIDGNKQFVEIPNNPFTES